MSQAAVPTWRGVSGEEVEEVSANLAGIFRARVRRLLALLFRPYRVPLSGAAALIVREPGASLATPFPRGPALGNQAFVGEIIPGIPLCGLRSRLLDLQNGRQVVFRGGSNHHAQSEPATAWKSRFASSWFSLRSSGCPRPPTATLLSARPTARGGGVWRPPRARWSRVRPSGWVR